MRSFWQGPLTSLALTGFAALVIQLILGTEAALAALGYEIGIEVREKRIA